MKRYSGKKNRILAVVIAFVMVISLTTACGGSGSGAGAGSGGAGAGNTGTGAGISTEAVTGSASGSETKPESGADSAGGAADDSAVGAADDSAATAEKTAAGGGSGEGSAASAAAETAQVSGTTAATAQVSGTTAATASETSGTTGAAAARDGATASAAAGVSGTTAATAAADAASDTEAAAAASEEPAIPALDAVLERGVLIVGTAGDYQPMSYLDPESGEYVGFDAELAKDLAGLLGVRLEYVETSWPTLMEDTLAHKFDLAVCGITITDARKDQALMSEGYLENGKTVLCRAEDADKYTSLEAINNPEVRVMENPGGLNEKFARENLPDATLMIHSVNQEIPGLIASGEADVMITEIMEAGYYVGRDDRLAAPLIYEPFTQGQLGFLMPKGSEDLLEYVNNFIDYERNNGRLDELAEEYIYKYIDRQNDGSENPETGDAPAAAAAAAAGNEPGTDGVTDPAGAAVAASDTSAIPFWSENSPAMASIVEYVNTVTDESSPDFIPVEDRIVVFDFDGTLYGELFPTYFDNCLLIHRALHDETYTAPEETKKYAQALEDSLKNHTPEPESDKSTAQYTAEVFSGMTVEEYRDYVREFMAAPAEGFEGMTYGEGFYEPMKALVQYLAERRFTVFVSSGSERSMVRELMEGVLDKWIPSNQVIGSTFSLAASGQGDKAGRSYSYKADDRILMEGNLVTKNQKTNKIFSIIDEIGKTPVLVFGNSSGDLPMARYAIQNGGRAYMLLCDDTERDYGDTEKAAAFAQECAEMGAQTISMKDEFATIYGENVVKTQQEEAAAAAASAAESSTAAAPEATSSGESGTAPTPEAVPAGETGTAPTSETAPAGDASTASPSESEPSVEQGTEQEEETVEEELAPAA